MGPAGKYILEFHRTFRWLPSSAGRRRHVQARTAIEGYDQDDAVLGELT